jgi:hypothetical protein
VDFLHLVLCVLDDVLEVLVAVLEYQVLCCLTIVTPAVENVKHLNNVFAVNQFAQNFVLTADVLSSFLRSLDGDRLTSIFVKCFKNIAYREKELVSPNLSRIGMYKFPIKNIWSAVITAIINLLEVPRKK